MNLLLVVLLSVGLAWQPVTSAVAAPTIGKLSLQGLQVGAKTTVVLDGSELSADTRILLPIPGVTEAIRPGATAQRVEYEVTVAADVPAGVYPLRVYNARGVSNMILVAIDRLPQQPWSAEIEQLPVSRHASLAGDQRLTTKLRGQKGQRLVVDIAAQRLGSPLRPVVRLYDAQGVQVAWSGPRSELAGDARISTTLPADGSYTIEVHDLLYRAPGNAFFRVAAGDLKLVDTLLPSGATLRTKQPLEFLTGNQWSAAPEPFDATNITVPTIRPVGEPPGALWTGPAPRLTLSDFPELREAASSASGTSAPGASTSGTPAAAPAAGSPQMPLPPPTLAYSGVLSAVGEEDRVTVAVTAGMRLRCDLQARALGSPLDGVLAVLGPQGNALGNSDDRPGSPDPLLDLTVPGGVDKITFVLKDLQGRGGPAYFYRLVVRDLAKPDFNLTLTTDRLQIPSGGSQVLLVPINRQEYAGEIGLVASGLPTGVQLSTSAVPAGGSLALIGLTAADGTPPAASIAKLLGRTPDGTPAIVRAAVGADQPALRSVPWVREELAVAVTEPTPVRIAWREPTPASETLPLGFRLPIQLVLKRDAAATGNVQLRLITTQPIPKKTVKQNNADVQVDDLDRALRLDTIAPVAAGMNEVTATLLVPADLPSSTWSFAVVADLLAADNKTVVSSTATAVRSLATRPMLSLMVTSAAALEGKVGAGDTGKVTGKLVRDPALTGPVAITLVGLPEGVVAPKLELPAGQTDFTLPLNFPAGTNPGEVKGVRVVATTAPDSQMPTIVARSVEVPLTIKIVP
ncbi:MAG: hypothetical protein ACKOBW_06645 [Planctomycetota bacterium]